MGAVGSTLGGAGGLIIFVLYLIFGPGGLIFHLGRLIRYKIRGTGLNVREYDMAVRFLVLNTIVTLVPVGLWALSFL